MKLRLKQTERSSLYVKPLEAPTLESKSSKRGPKNKLGPSERFSVFIPYKLRKEHSALLDALRKHKVKVKFSLATVLREGAKMFLRQKARELLKAVNGELHAKKR